jgi:hypothetical protein
MSYHKVNYKASGVDFADYFPAYEVAIISNTLITPDVSFLVNLSKNKYSTTNYVSFIQPYYGSPITGLPPLTIYDLAERIHQISIYNKTTSSYNVWVKSDNFLGDALTMTWWCVTFYTHETERQLVSSIPNTSYKVNTSDYNPCIHFPQFRIDQNDVSTTGNVYFENSLATKNTSSTTYLNFGSITNNSTPTTLTAGNIQKIMYYEYPKASTKYGVVTYTSGTPSIKINTITMYFDQITSTVNNFNSKYNMDGIELEKTFPICEKFTVSMLGRVTGRDTTFTLTKNTNATTNYVVISSYTYNHDGSGGTYNPYEASINVGTAIIHTKTATTFTVTTITTNGDNWNGTFNCLVIYN